MVYNTDWLVNYMTNSVETSHSSEADSSSAGKEILRVFRNTKVHYRI